MTKVEYVEMQKKLSFIRSKSTGTRTLEEEALVHFIYCSEWIGERLSSDRCLYSGQGQNLVRAKGKELNSRDQKIKKNYRRFIKWR